MRVPPPARRRRCEVSAPVKVGDRFLVERRYVWQGQSETPSHAHEAIVSRVTPNKRAYLGTSGGYITLTSCPPYTVKPRYLDYRTTATPIEGAGQPDDGEGSPR